MSKKIIYAEDAAEAVIRHLQLDYDYAWGVREAINSLPSAQPQRMKGKWIDITKTGGDELWKCSECGELELEDSYYCPNCGADMRGDEDG